jgi:hypothetical protein
VKDLNWAKGALIGAKYSRHGDLMLFIVDGSERYMVEIAPDTSGNLIVTKKEPQYGIYFTDAKGENAVLMTKIFKEEIPDMIKLYNPDLDSTEIEDWVFNIEHGDRFYGSNGLVYISKIEEDRVNG